MTKPFASIALPLLGEHTDEILQPARLERSKPRGKKVSSDPTSLRPDITRLGKNCTDILANLRRLTLSVIELGTERPAYLDQAIFYLNWGSQQGTMS
jgi:hypothetical protein